MNSKPTELLNDILISKIINNSYKLQNIGPSVPDIKSFTVVYSEVNFHIREINVTLFFILEYSMFQHLWADERNKLGG